MTVSRRSEVRAGNWSERLILCWSLYLRFHGQTVRSRPLPSRPLVADGWYPLYRLGLDGYGTNAAVDGREVSRPSTAAKLHPTATDG